LSETEGAVWAPADGSVCAASLLDDLFLRDFLLLGMDGLGVGADASHRARERTSPAAAKSHSSHAMRTFVIARAPFRFDR
jgi:hypothetical protein